jgi:hypothetical protein
MYLKVARHVDTVCLLCRYASYDNSTNPGSTSCNKGNCKKKKKKLQKFGEGNLYEESEDEYVDIYIEQS